MWRNSEVETLGPFTPISVGKWAGKWIGVFYTYFGALCISHRRQSPIPSC